jgi:iron(III) transport system permease protein
MGWMCGGSWLKTLREVVLPTLRGSLWSAWIIIFLMAFREIPLSTMLYINGSETVGVLLFILKTEAGGPEVTSAVSIVVMLLTILGQTAIRHLTRTNHKWQVEI